MLSSFLIGFLGRLLGFFRGFVWAVRTDGDLFLGITKSSVCVRFASVYMRAGVRVCAYAYMRARAWGGDNSFMLCSICP